MAFVQDLGKNEPHLYKLATEFSVASGHLYDDGSHQYKLTNGGHDA